MDPPGRQGRDSAPPTACETDSSVGMWPWTGLASQSARSGISTPAAPADRCMSMRGASRTRSAWKCSARPTLTCPQGVVRECEGPSGAAVFYSVPATNRCAVNDLAVTCRPPSGSRFPPGVTLVHCVAAGSGQSTQCDFPVTVLGASPDTRHLVAARTIGAAAVAVTATTMTPTNPVPRSHKD